MTHANDPADPDATSETAVEAQDAPSSPVAPAADAPTAVVGEQVAEPYPEDASSVMEATSAPVEGDDEEHGAEEPAIDPADIARIKAMFSRFVQEPPQEPQQEAPVENGGETAGEAEDAAAFRFARWDRGLSPRVFGVDEASETAILSGVNEAARLAGVQIVEEDPEFEANLLIFVCDEWRDLKQTPGLKRLIPDLDKLVVILAATGANQYRIFSFSEEAGLRLAVVLVRCDEMVGRMSARALGLSQTAQTLLLWSDGAFVDEGPVATSRRGEARIKPWISDLLAASYEGGVPVYSEDVGLLERLAASAAARRRAAKAASAARKSGDYERRSAPESGEGETAPTNNGESAAEEQVPVVESSVETVATEPEAVEGVIAAAGDETADVAPSPEQPETEAVEAPAPKPVRKRRSRAKKPPAPAVVEAEPTESEPVVAEPAETEPVVAQAEPAADSADALPIEAPEPSETPRS
ncbi:MAG: hypothetical protein KTR21_18515 [Rhodobacteraceae bacterium]|nr:hypothetical protein [Paracoccaceae bacterium]